jgi:hypothetical protein
MRERCVAAVVTELRAWQRGRLERPISHIEREVTELARSLEAVQHEVSGP